MVREPRYQDLLTQVEMQQGEVEWETYIAGNPPYRGSAWQTKEQKKDLGSVAGHLKSWKSLDYIAGWFIKATEYCATANAKSGLVSTNSICQGEQVPALWPWVFDQGVEIGFAHLSFK